MEAPGDLFRRGGPGYSGQSKKSRGAERGEKWGKRLGSHECWATTWALCWGSGEPRQYGREGVLGQNV